MLRAVCVRLIQETELQNGEEKYDESEYYFDLSISFCESHAKRDREGKATKIQNNKNISSSESRLKNAIQISHLFVWSLSFVFAFNFLFIGYACI